MPADALTTQEPTLDTCHTETSNLAVTKEETADTLLAEQKTDTPYDTALANSDGKRGMESTSLSVPLKQQGMGSFG